MKFNSFENFKKINIKQLASLGVVALLSILPMKAKAEAPKVNNLSDLKKSSLTSGYTGTPSDGFVEATGEQDLEGGGDDIKIEVKADDNTKITFFKNEQRAYIRIKYFDKELDYSLFNSYKLITKIKFNKRDSSIKELELEKYTVGEKNTENIINNTYYFDIEFEDGTKKQFIFDTTQTENGEKKIDNPGIE